MGRRERNPSDTLNDSDACRLDIWLVRTRLLKTRGLAAKLISKGKIRVRRNGQMDRVKKPHALVRPGDHVTFMRGTELISVEMVAAGTRRGPAPEAQKLYRRQSDSSDTIY